MTAVWKRRLHEIFKRCMADVEAAALGGRQLTVKRRRSKTPKNLLCKVSHIQGAAQRRQGTAAPAPPLSEPSDMLANLEFNCVPHLPLLSDDYVAGMQDREGFHLLVSFYVFFTSPI